MPTSYEVQRDGLHAQADAYAAAYGLQGARNGDWDAFRHAFVSAEMTRIYGAGTAKFLGDMNEIKGQFTQGQPHQEKNMDLWNNKAGRDIGSHTSSAEQTARKVMNALENGALITEPNVDGRQNSTGQQTTDDSDPDVPCCDECGAAANWPPPTLPPRPGEVATGEDGGTMYIPIVDLTPAPIPAMGTAARTAMALSAESLQDNIDTVPAKGEPEHLQANIDNAMALVAETYVDAMSTGQLDISPEQVAEQHIVTLDNQREHDLVLG
ncbi:MAG TPA: hypothetical protein VF670_07030 [Duganella sp.]|jgi:hypothetical protein